MKILCKNSCVFENKHFSFFHYLVFVIPAPHEQQTARHGRGEGTAGDVGAGGGAQFVVEGGKTCVGL